MDRLIPKQPVVVFTWPPPCCNDTHRVRSIRRGYTFYSHLQRANDFMLTSCNLMTASYGPDGVVGGLGDTVDPRHIHVDYPRDWPNNNWDINVGGRPLVDSLNVLKWITFSPPSNYSGIWQGDSTEMIQSVKTLQFTSVRKSPISSIRTVSESTLAVCEFWNYYVKGYSPPLLGAWQSEHFASLNQISSVTYWLLFRSHWQ